MNNKFVARFRVKTGDKTSGFDKEVIQKVISVDRLKETKLKPPDTFVFQKGTYLFNPNAVRKYDKKNRPIIEYYLGNAMPVTDTEKEPTVIDNDGNKRVISSYLLYQTWNRGEMKSVIASSQAEKSPLSIIQIIMGLVAGLGLGFVIAISIYPDLFPRMVVH